LRIEVAMSPSTGTSGLAAQLSRSLAGNTTLATNAAASTALAATFAKALDTRSLTTGLMPSLTEMSKTLTGIDEVLTDLGRSSILWTVAVRDALTYHAEDGTRLTTDSTATGHEDRLDGGLTEYERRLVEAYLRFLCFALLIHLTLKHPAASAIVLAAASIGQVASWCAEQAARRLP
jgi:hypothetical protein